MVLAEPRGAVAVLFQDLADGRALRPDDRVVARITCRKFANDTESDRVMIATSDQRRTGGRAKCSGMELSVAKTCFGECVHHRRRDNAAKCAGDTVTLVISHDK